MNRLAIGVLALLASCNPAFAQRAVVCPSNLSYCYEKPVLKEKRVIDEYNDIVEEMRQARIALELRSQASSAGLDYQLERALRLRR
jgi:hypothetical protein